MSMGRKIFISYRREADAGHAGRLHEDLSERFCSRNLFIDLELRPGQHWQERIEQAVGACDVVLPVIGTRWATVTKERESGRLERSEDWVKLEIETALMRQDVVRDTRARGRGPDARCRGPAGEPAADDQVAGAAPERPQLGATTSSG